MPDLLIDTDAGIDDLLALCFVLNQSAYNIAAITVVNGLAHVEAGATNILRILQLANRLDIPVYKGAVKPSPGGTDFPEDWRKTADELPGVDLPSTSVRPKEDAIGYLAQCFSSNVPATLLALGPQTNLAKALSSNGNRKSGIDQMIMMGGAVFVEGNVTGDPSAEWNIFEDPNAAAAVFSSGMPIRMVPLDATQYVPIDQSFLNAAQKFTSPLGKVVSQLLTLGYTSNDGDYFAWDPLAAVSVTVPTVVTAQSLDIQIVTTPPGIGRTENDPDGTPNAAVATTADPKTFGDAFLGAFS
jgi:purine nucleosidase